MSSTASPIRLSLDNAVNLRDVGGLPCRDGGSTRHLALLRSGSLHLLTATDARVLMSVCDVAVVVDLRTARELAADGPSALARAGVATVHLPLAREDRPLLPEAVQDPTVQDPTVQDPTAVQDPMGALGRAYREYLDERGHHLVTLARTIAGSGGATLVHCAAGKDRTGVLVALVLDAVGVERAAVIADYALSAEQVEAMWRRWTTREGVAMPDDLTPHLPRAEVIAAVLARLDAEFGEGDRGEGGAAGWLRANGLPDEALARLRRRLTGR